jgi:hypothetical protein
MTAVHIARVEHLIPPGQPIPDRLFTHVIVVADPVLDRLAASAASAAGRPAAATAPAWPAPTRGRPRYEPRNLAFGAGLDGWMFDGSFSKHASESHWHDYAFAAQDGVAVIRSAVARPEGFAMLRQAIFADDYRGATVTFRGEFRTVPGAGSAAGAAAESAAGRAGLFLRVNIGPDIGGPLSYGAALTSTDHNAVALAGDRAWTSHELTARVPEDSDAVVFGVFLAGRGRIELRHLELISGAP